MLFWNNDYSRGLAGHMRPASAQCCWLCHLSSDGLVGSDCTQSGTVHRKYTGLSRRIDRNEYYFALLYIVRQVTIPYSALQFRRNSPVFWCFEIPCQDIRYRVAHACGSRCTRGCKHWAPLCIARPPHEPPAILSCTPGLAGYPLRPHSAVAWLAAGRLFLF